MPKLVDARTGEERELLKPVTLIGRAEYCDVCVPIRSVSREHARIRRRITGCYIEDLGSTHGTRVNGQRIRGRTKLRDGDCILVGAAPPHEHPTSSVHRVHTDTVDAPESEEAPDADAGAGPKLPQGAQFVFRT